MDRELYLPVDDPEGHAELLEQRAATRQTSRGLFIVVLGLAPLCWAAVVALAAAGLRWVGQISGGLSVVAAWLAVTAGVAIVTGLIVELADSHAKRSPGTTP